ncbi:pentatricopeptide repeat-containing protein At5g39350-like [Musa acuminata AAA Group]|uniref:pentatricopeptide repeat-containing protein At5g39350-like n=1 Tax=Musa acuminata AAA Group TaxID=214697 RepID=UPI0031CFF7E7
MYGSFFKHPSTNQCLPLLQSLIRSRSSRLGAQLHAFLISSGVLSSAPRRGLLLSKLVVLYSLSGQPSRARQLFDRISRRTPFLWNALIRGHAQSGLPLDALRLFARMVFSGLSPDYLTYPFALKACADLSLGRLGAQVHGKSLASGFGADEYVQNCLIAMYMSCGDTNAATKVFDLMTARSIVSWNTVIAGCCRNGFAREALAVFDRMMDAGVGIDEATVVSVLPACAHLKDLRRGRFVQKLVDEGRFDADSRVRNSLIDMYAKCGCLEEARKVFDGGQCERDVVAWTAMIGAYALHGRESEALALSRQMQSVGVRPNPVTMVSLLSACSALPSLAHGKCVHGSCIRLHLESDIIVETTLIDMYAKCSGTGLYLRVFSSGSRRTATWNAVISGCSRNRQAEDAIKYYRQMLAEAVRPDFATVLSLLPAYAESADLKQADNLHGCLIGMGFTASAEVMTGLIDVYGKAGKLDVAWQLFGGLQVKDLVSWSAIIAGYGMHGHAKTAIWLFDRMVKSGVAPSEVTFTSMFYSCSHAGLVDEGLQLFDKMSNAHGVKPNADHYACVVDLLGRAGRLREAYELIAGMPFEPNHAVWGALLGACGIHENVELGELAAKRLFEIEPENTGNYVLLGNIYAAVGRWEDVESVRSMMVRRGLRKAPGRSLVEARKVQA